MSLAEFLVIVVGLCGGYWLVAANLTNRGGSKTRESPSSDRAFAGDHTKSDVENNDAWYDILGVSSNASIDEIRIAYKTLISQYHPDKVEILGVDLKELAEKKSKEITKAYRDAMRVRGVDR